MLDIGASDARWGRDRLQMKADVNKVKSDKAVETVRSYLSRRYRCKVVTRNKEGKHKGFDIHDR